MRFKCSVCWDWMEFNKEYDIYTTKCGHIFHFSCLASWLNSWKICPQCRESCNHSDIFKLFFSAIIDESNSDEKLDSETVIRKLSCLQVMVEEISVSSEETRKCLTESIRVLSDRLESETLDSNELKFKIELMQHEQNHFGEYLAEMEKTVKILNTKINQKNQLIFKLTLENEFLTNELAECKINLLEDLQEKINDLEANIELLEIQNQNYLKTIQFLELEN